MMLFGKIFITFESAALSLLALLISVSDSSSPTERQQALFLNKFEKPSDVVRYYCERDAAGFVWSGFMTAEREEFTLWPENPRSESFYIAKKYTIKSESIETGKNDASITVHYELTGTGDGYGNMSSAPGEDYYVTFRLKKIDGRWKIYQPLSKNVHPVVLQAHFPFER